MTCFTSVEMSFINFCFPQLYTESSSYIPIAANQQETRQQHYLTVPFQFVAQPLEIAVPSTHTGFFDFEHWQVGLKKVGRSSRTNKRRRTHLRPARCGRSQPDTPGKGVDSPACGLHSRCTVFWPLRA